MRRILLTSVAAAAAVAPSAAAPVAGGWRITRLDLAAHVTPATRLLRVSGDAHVRRTGDAAAGPVLAFGPGGVVFDSARVNVPAAVSFNAARDSLLVRPTGAMPAELIVTFFAHADRDLNRSQVRPSGAMISWGARWYPAIATRADSTPDIAFPGTTRVTIPMGWRSLSVGALADSAVADGERTELWRADRPTMRSFVAAEFVPVWTRVDSALVAVYLLPRHAHRMREYAEAIPRMVRELSRAFGPYPFDAFGIAELPREVAPFGFGGRAEPGYFIAHTDALVGAGVNVTLFAHELTHMWFPMAVDSRPPGDDMMDEAIANYGVTVYREAVEGRAAAYREIVDGHPDYSMRAYFHELRRGADEPLMADYNVGIARAKGPMVYDMLRRRVGDSAFFGVWRDLAARGGGASLADLRHLYLARVPRDTGLAAFLAQWMDRRGAPAVAAEPDPRVPGRVTLRHLGDVYALDIPVTVRGSARTVDTVLRLASRSRAYTLPVGRVRAVDVDPRDELLLWKPRFGPPPHAPASWSTAAWERWMADEVPWLMRGYEARGASVALVRAGRVAWTASYGDAPPPPGPARALLDSLGTARDSVRTRLTTAGDDVTFAAVAPGGHSAIIVVARGGWGGRQLTMHIAQRVAVQARWAVGPR